jgi:putative nucleotidyltransferase with HDIG domain
VWSIDVEINRDEVWKLVIEYTKSESLIHHMLAVEAAMRAYARHYGEDEEVWGALGLIHDFDYERYPGMGPETPDSEKHCLAGAAILREKGYPESFIRAVLAHATYSGVHPETRMEKTLFAVDELTGLIQAVAYVRPSKNIADVEVKSVRKKWKDRAFAAAVDRDEIERAAADLGVDLTEHIQIVLDALKGIAPQLGLDGRLAQSA